MSSYSLSNLSSNTKYGIAGFLVGGLGAYSLSAIWSGDSSSSSRTSSEGSGYGLGLGLGSTSNSTSNSNGSSMFGGASKHSRRHKKHSNKTRSKK